MAPYITLYILGGCVAVAAALFIVMIVLSMVRPPQLPDVTIDPVPLQRMIRALTPVPFATPVAAPPANVQARHVQAPPLVTAPVIATPARPAAPPVAPPRPTPPPVAPPRPTPPPVAPPRPTPPPVAQTQPARPAVAPSVPARHVPQQPRVRPPLAKSPITLPVYPARRSRTFARIVLGLVMTSVVAAGAVVAYPALLDPLCDDYEWFGSEGTQVVRQHARDAHAAIAEFVHGL